MKMTKYSLFTVFKTLLGGLFTTFNHHISLYKAKMPLFCGVFSSSASQPVVLHWRHAEPISVLCQGTADNVSDCNQASSCLNACSRLQELKELRLHKPWHKLWEMCVEIHVLLLTCWATLSKQSRTTIPWAPISHQVPWETGMSCFGGIILSLYGS